VEGDSASARDFRTWLATARRLRVTAVADEGPLQVDADRAILDVRVWLQWSVKFAKDPRRPVRFRLTFASAGGQWPLRSVRLLDGFVGR
jgi:hypothetical protein